MSGDIRKLLKEASDWPLCAEFQAISLTPIGTAWNGSCHGISGRSLTGRSDAPFSTCHLAFQVSEDMRSF